MRLICFLLLFLCSAPIWAQNTLPYLDGVPIMNAFSLSDDDVMMFDKPEGRVVDITIWCASDCPSNDVIDGYYTNSMARLGWATGTSRQFSNNGLSVQYEILRDLTENSVIILFRSNG